MNKLFEFLNGFSRESDWKDFALVKLCLFSAGIAAGTQIPDKYRKKAVGAATCVFASTSVPLLIKAFRLALKRT